VAVLTCFVMCGCVGILVIYVFVFTVFCIVCTVFLVLFRLCIFILYFLVYGLLPLRNNSTSVIIIKIIIFKSVVKA